MNARGTERLAERALAASDEHVRYSEVTMRMAEANLRRLGRPWLWPMWLWTHARLQGRLAAQARQGAEVADLNAEVARRLAQP